MSLGGEPGGVSIQPRDILLLRGLFESRIMTLAHVAQAYFEGRQEAAKKRAQKLKAAGLLRERPRMPYDPSVLCLTSTGFTFLSQHGYLSDYPRISAKSFEARVAVSPLTVRHELEVASVKAAFIASVARAPALELVEFSTWPKLSEFRVSTSRGGYGGGQESLVKPDGFIRIHETDATGTSEHCFFLEVDRSTESRDVLLRRIECYLAYYRTGGFAEWMGATAEEFKNYPFRVLVTCKSFERHINIAERLLACTPPILHQVWITTTSALRDDCLGPIWMPPRAYRDISAHVGVSAFSARQPASGVMQMSAERKAHLQANIRLRRLLDEER